MKLNIKSIILRLTANKKKSTVVLIGLILICVAGVIGWQKYSQDNQKKEKEALSQQAAKAGFDGNFNEYIEANKKLYELEKDKKAKAEFAGLVGWGYYSNNDIENGRMWINKAIQEHKASGNNEQAENLSQSASQEEKRIKDYQAAPKTPNGNSAL